MPIFGQVWLWSSLAFLLGALLCWLLVARPARSRVGELENQLATRARRQPSEHAAEPGRRHDDRAETDFGRGMVPGLGERQDDDSSEYLTRAYALPREAAPPAPPMQPDRGRLAPYAEPELFGEPARDQQPYEPESSQPFSAFDGGFDRGLVAQPETDVTDTELADHQPPAAPTQYIDVSAGSLTAPPEVPAMSPPPSDRGWFDDELDGDAAGQAPEDQPALPRNRHVMAAETDVDSRLVDDDTDIGSVLGVDETAAAEQEQGTERPEPRSAIEDDGGTVFTQRTHPIPGELIRQIDEAGQEEVARSEQSDGFVDDLAEEPGDDENARRERTVESEPVAPAAGTSNGRTSPEPEAVASPELPQEQTEVVSAVRSTASDLPRRVPQTNRMTPGVAVRVEPTPNALPKRVPGKPRHQVPFGVQPEASEPASVAAATSVSEAAAPPQDVESSRSLFEPIVPADEGAAVPPPPHRLRQANGSGGRGPFGPGSAMPLPGGASPSPEFTIKASVAALRYCTPESPQFGRTVAEVWFRTAADAERVGFRPVG